MSSYKKPYSTQSRPAYKKSTVIPGSQYKPVTNPSDEQQVIIDAVVDGDRSLLVSAYAGVGKTTTCVEAMHRVVKKNPRLQQGYIIFAKRNQEEAVGKCPTSALIKTSHSFGMMALGATFGKIMVDKQKTKRIVESLVGPNEEKDDLRHMLVKAVELGKDYLVERPEEVVAVMEKHGIEPCELSEQEFAHNVLEGMRISTMQPNMVSFSDMIYLPIKLGIRIPTLDILYADECQDLNKSRIELIIRALGSKGRLISVGDSFQAIFGFSGADKYALDTIKQRTNAIDLPLHRTYRCGKAIVRMAQQFVPDYQAAETNSEGEVCNVSHQEMMGDNGARAGDFVLSRTNSPIIRIAMQLLAHHKKCNIQGKSIGDDLLFMIKRSKAKDVLSFQSWLQDWSSAEIERLTKKDRDADVSHITDRAECLETFCEGERELSAVRSNIEQMFDDNETDEEHRIVLSSVHRAKGLERDRVYLLEKTFVMKPKNEDEKIAERNVRYVAFTRPKNSLFLVG